MSDNNIGYTMPQLLKALVDQDGSDLHISPQSPPRLRIHGKLLPLEVVNLAADQTKSLCYSILTENQKKKLEEESEVHGASVRNCCCLKLLSCRRYASLQQLPVCLFPMCVYHVFQIWVVVLLLFSRCHCLRGVCD